MSVVDGGGEGGGGEGRGGEDGGAEWQRRARFNARNNIYKMMRPQSSRRSHRG